MLTIISVSKLVQSSKLINNIGLYKQGVTLKPELMSGLHTDFIFSYITFSFGWIVACILAALVVTLIIRMTYIITVVKDNYAKQLSIGFVSIFVAQFLWNILMNLGLAPISGVGLPFISFGGSQLILSSAALGIILSIYKLKKILTTLSN